MPPSPVLRFLGGPKENCAEIAAGADAPAAIPRSAGVGGILDDGQAARLRDRGQRIEIAGIAAEMHRHDSAGAIGEPLLHRSGVDVAGQRVNVGKYRLEPFPEQRLVGRHERDRSRDDLRAARQRQQANRDVQRCGATARGDRVRCT